MIVVGIAVCRRTVASDGLDEISLDDRAGAALLRRDGRSWAAHVHAGADRLRPSEAVGGRVVPLLARREAADNLSVLDDPQIADSVRLTLRARVQSNVALGCNARSAL